MLRKTILQGVMASSHGSLSPFHKTNFWRYEMSSIYATDLDPEKRTDAFMGEGFEKMLKEAEDKDTVMIVGEFCKNTEWRLE